MSIPDELILRYFKLVTNTLASELSAIETQLNNGENPRNIKLALATTIVSEFHSAKDAALAKENFINVFSKKQYQMISLKFKLAIQTHYI